MGLPHYLVQHFCHVRFHARAQTGSQDDDADIFYRIVNHPSFFSIVEYYTGCSEAEIGSGYFISL